MVKRHYWLDLIEQQWSWRPIVWLAGVRRAGKTVICQSLDGVEYFDCELPLTRQKLNQPQKFLDRFRGKRIVLDEIHRLTDPSELLKIAHDHYPDVKVIATGSSTLQASRKFKDTLTGRKAEIWLTPMNLADLRDFESYNIERRLIAGGLPQFFIERDRKQQQVQEWLDSFWAKDIQELFRLERRDAFMRLVELLIVDSGGLFEATRYASSCEISRQTVKNYVTALEATKVVQLLRPFSTRMSNEIRSMPKVYALDTGFVSCLREWHRLSADSKGRLWEHFVLNEMNSALQGQKINYWRDRQGHEVDFIISSYSKKAPTAIECKWSSDSFDARALKVFRHKYPEGKNYLVTFDCDGSYEQSIAGLDITVTSLAELIPLLKENMALT